MNLEETVEKLTELEIKFEGLKNTMEVFQESINNSFYWFFAVVGIFITLLGVVGVALYFIVQTAINKGVEKGINDVTSIVQKEIASIRKEMQGLKENHNQQINDILTDYNEFQSNLDNRVIRLIEDNPQINWTKGTVSSLQIKGGNFMLMGFKGIINWESPFTSLEIIDSKTSEPIEFEIVDYYNDGMVVKVEGLEKDRITIIDYTFIWTTHDID